MGIVKGDNISMIWIKVEIVFIIFLDSELGGHVCIVIVTVWLIRYSLGTEDALQGDSHIQNWVRQIVHENSYSAAKLHGKQRVARAISDPRKNCSTWAEWVNENHPSLSHKEDREFISQRTRHDFCPSGNISKFECKDDKGEPFQRNFTSLGGAFFISCYDINVGVICTILNTSGSYIKHCPDMSIRYYCSCPALPTGHSISAGIPSTSTIRMTSFPTAKSSISTRVSHMIPVTALTSSASRTTNSSTATSSVSSRVPSTTPTTTRKKTSTFRATTFSTVARPVRTQVTHRIPATTQNTTSAFRPTKSTVTHSVKTQDPSRFHATSPTRTFVSSLISTLAVHKSVTSNTPRLVKTSAITDTATNVYVKETKEGNTYKEEAKLKLGDLSIRWWIFVLVVVGFIFLLNTCISVCLYKKVKNMLKKKHPKQAVHPLKFV